MCAIYLRRNIGVANKQDELQDDLAINWEQTWPVLALFLPSWDFALALARGNSVENCQTHVLLLAHRAIAYWLSRQ